MRYRFRAPGPFTNGSRESPAGRSFWAALPSWPLLRFLTRFNRSFRSRRFRSTSSKSAFCLGRSAMRWSSIEKYLLALEPDRLLHTFRLNAGLPSTAKPLGGWEEPKGELRGHFVGHYLSACALMYASTGDERFKAKASRSWRAGRVPAKARQRLPERLPRGVHRPRGEPASRSGPLGTRCTRSSPACST